MLHNWFGTFIDMSFGFHEGRKDELGMKLFHLEKDFEWCLGVDGSLSLQFEVKVHYGNGVENPKTTVTNRGAHQYHN